LLETFIDGEQLVVFWY